jgi:hypothetical protein
MTAAAVLQLLLAIRNREREEAGDPKWNGGSIDLSARPPHSAALATQLSSSRIATRVHGFQKHTPRPAHCAANNQAGSVPAARAPVWVVAAAA